MLTTREVIKTFYNALLQRLKKHRGDWNQNDPTADDYIKNRPFYTDENDKTVNVPEQKITIPSKIPYFAQLFLPELIEFVVGQTYEVKWDDETYSCVAFDLNGISAIGNQGVFGDGTDTGEPFIMMISKAEGFERVFAPEAIGTHTVEVTTTKVVKLDKKYLPDLGLAPVATSGSYDDLENAPTVYSDVVRYNGGQNLSGIQKEQARVNIGAISSDEVTGVVKYTAQSLTDTQKAQARTNIGAGTSSFSGSYNDLTNKPLSLSAITQSNTSTTQIDVLDYTIIDAVRIYPTRYIFDISSINLANAMIRAYRNHNNYYMIYSPETHPWKPVNNVKVNNVVYYGVGIGENVGIPSYEKYFFISNNGFIIISDRLVNKEETINYFKIIFGGADLSIPIAYLSEIFIPPVIQRVGNDLILSSSTPDSTKRFKITVDDSGALTTEAVTE